MYIIEYEEIDKINIERFEEFREGFIYISKRPQILEALKANNHELVNQMIDKYTGAFDIEYTNSTGEYYLALKNESKLLNHKLC